MTPAPPEDLARTAAWLDAARARLRAAGYVEVPPPPGRPLPALARAGLGAVFTLGGSPPALAWWWPEADEAPEGLLADLGLPGAPRAWRGGGGAGAAWDLPAVAPPRGATLRRLDELVGEGLVSADEAPALARALEGLPLAVSPAMRPLLQAGGPIARQLVPDAAELLRAPGEVPDPIGDARHSPRRGVVHRYPDRLLVLPTLACAVYCRFCFRRDVVGQGGLTADERDAALDYVRAHPEVQEVILTGGDPLSMSPGRLSEWLAPLAAIPHVRWLRVHTRVPLMAPERVDGALLDALCVEKPVFVALHANHAQEFTDAGRVAVARLVDAGLPMVSQTVLLRGVNDTPEALEALLRALVAARVKPYYLHLLDAAEGTSHFRVPLERARALVDGLRGRVSGLALPTLVLDLPGGFGKVPAGGAWLEARDGRWVGRDPGGGEHALAPISGQDGA